MLLDLIFSAIELIADTVIDIIDGIISFVKDIVDWFKKKHLQQGHDIPFVANAKDPQFQNLLKNAPVKDAGIFEGVYNQDTEQIEGRAIYGDGIDEQTRQVLGQEPLVVLS